MCFSFFFFSGEFPQMIHVFQVRFHTTNIQTRIQFCFPLQICFPCLLKCERKTRFFVLFCINLSRFSVLFCFYTARALTRCFRYFSMQFLSLINYQCLLLFSLPFHHLSILFCFSVPFYRFTCFVTASYVCGVFSLRISLIYYHLKIPTTTT